MKNIFASSTIGAQLYLLMSLVLSIAAFFYYGITVENLSIVLLGYFLYGCLGIAVMYHRNLSHSSYTTHPIIVKLFSFLGCLAATGSPIAWVAIHINHHLNSDKQEDPHSPYHKGLKMFILDYEAEIKPNTKWRMRELITDKYQQFLHKFYFLIIFLYALAVYLIGGFYLLAFFLLAPAAVTGILSNVVNYIGHMPTWFGSSRRYNLNDKSTNNWVWAIPTWGESWHNNHHRLPRSYKSGHAWYEIDPAAYIIKIIKTS